MLEQHCTRRTNTVGPTRAARAAAWLALALLACTGCALAQPGPNSDDLIAIGDKLDDAKFLAVDNGTVSVQGPRVLRLTAAEAKRASLSISAPDGVWDLSARADVVVMLKNPSAKRVLVYGRAENPGAEFRRDACQSVVSVEPGQQANLGIRLVRRPEDPGYEYFKPYFMYTRSMTVREGTVDPAQIAKITISFDAEEPNQAIDITSVAAEGEGRPAPVPFFPFVDEFGQYIHADWPGKVYGPEQLAEARREEEADLARNPGPADWNEYGGYERGPQLDATGFFYPAKHDGRWWLVDPKGRLFWSYGPTGVGIEGASPITGKEHWFAWLPQRGDGSGEFDSYFSNGRNARFMFYQDKQFTRFDFAKANAHRKYGPDWANLVRELQHRRLRSWGFNTIANWSDGQTMLMHKTPYVVAIHFHSMNFGHHHDVFDGKFQQDLRRRMEAEVGRTANDPWNIGYFVDNELDWGVDADFRRLGWNAIKSPPQQPAKIELVNDLKKKYETIDALNKAWETKFASWEALLENREAISSGQVAAIREDYGAFGVKFAQTYFRICREEVKRVAPNNLYLGCRFHGHKDISMMRLAGEYCDVISYNIYDGNPEGRLNQYVGKLDKPVIVGEWGVGSDLVQTPLRGDVERDRAWTPQQRVDAIRRYTSGAFRSPLLVGAHFFQMRDQALTGRDDGEAVLRGFVNVADTPNYLLVEANRQIAAQMYPARLGSEAKP